jgi:hypothetical protein
MPNKEPLFAELIEVLKKVKTLEDVPDNLYDEVLNVAVLLMVARVVGKTNCSEKEGLMVTGLAISKHIDTLIADAE